jgi:hypothetical protein
VVFISICLSVDPATSPPDLRYFDRPELPLEPATALSITLQDQGCSSEESARKGGGWSAQNYSLSGASALHITPSDEQHEVTGTGVVLQREYLAHLHPGDLQILTF